MMSCASVLEPLRAANLGGPAPLFDIVTFGASEGAVSSSGAILPTQHRVGETPPLNMFLVIAGGDPFAFEDADALDWLQRIAGRVPLVGGVSAGPVLLARAGLLKGRICTVHWEHAAELSTQHPDITVKRRLFVMERDRVTCGGGTAPMDLMHALIARTHGKAVARRVSDWFLHTDVRHASAPQRASYAGQAGRAPSVVQEAIALMEDHLSDPLSLPQLGLICGVSARQLNRLFADAFGTSTMAFYRRIRLDAGRHLVSTSTLSLVEIAEATGFHSAGHFSDQFAKAYAMRPSALR